MFSIHRASSLLIHSSRRLVRRRGETVAPLLTTNPYYFGARWGAQGANIKNPSRASFKRLFSSSNKVNAKDALKSKGSKVISIWNNRADFFNRKRFMNLNLSEMAGNLSSFLVLTAYTMTDIFALRVVSLVATSLALLFQYYRKIPLWIPIRWNFVLVLINVTMVTKLHLERQRADAMTPEMLELYQSGHFERRGFSKVEFLRLHDMAKVVELQPGTVLVKKGHAKHSLHFLLEGSVDVMKDGRKLAQLEQYKFVGEISLLGQMLLQNMNTGASADVVVNRNKPAKFLVWEFEELIPYLQEDRQVWNALAAYLNYDLTSKLLRDGVIQRATSTNHPLVLQEAPVSPTNNATNQP